MQLLNKIWNYIRTRHVLYHLGGAVLFYVLSVLVFALFVKSYTKHGQSVTVPDLRGKTYSVATNMIESRNLNYKIADSSYDRKLSPLAVMDQNPRPNTKVKESRTIYLTVNSRKAPHVKMPDLKDASLKQATMILESYKLNVGKLIYKPDLAKNVVLDQLYKGKTIAAGAEIQKGASVDLTLGDGLGETEIEVPHLIGLSLREAKFVLEGSLLSLGAVVHDDLSRGDSLEAIVYQQRPDPNMSETRTVNIGDGVDVFVTSKSHYSDAAEDNE